MAMPVPGARRATAPGTWRCRPPHRPHWLDLDPRLGREVACGKANIPIGHIAWLSRAPIRRAGNHRHPGLAKALLEIELSWESAPLHLFATHLSSRWDPPEPVEEISIILNLLRPLAGHPHLLVGDFNALRPGDPVGLPPEGVEKRGDAADARHTTRFG